HKKLHKSSDHKSLKVGIYLEERQVLNMNILFLFDSDMRGDGKYPYCRHIGESCCDQCNKNWKI
ncbi:hypothetical protein, partial [Blautia sp.]|uniref:hypothetical protein n=1 Tax=Blautia sp. TaxID=1955243 RepID=UPI003A8C96DC